LSIIRIAAALILGEDGRMLLVRKRGTKAFMLAGGKLCAGESAVDALERELGKELGCGLASAPEPLGHYSAPAANEAIRGHAGRRGHAGCRDRGSGLA
jgi:8-oxo-dGTP diphosphatase